MKPANPITRRLRSRHDGVERLPVPFIVGVGRSGTTLLRMMLDAHPELAIPPETHFVPRMIAACERALTSRRRVARAAIEHERGGFADSGIDPELFERRLEELEKLRTAAAIRAFYELYAEHHAKRRFGDKTPGYVRNMGRIGRVLPETRFIHVIRDGRDVALSVDRRLREVDGRERGVDMQRMAAKWHERILKARSVAEASLDGRYLELRYEDLVRDTEPTLRRVTELIDLEWDEVMLSYHERAAERLGELKDQDRRGAWVRSAESRLKAHEMTQRPPSPERLDVWRREMSAEQLADYESVAGGLLQELGYELGAGEAAPSETTREATAR